MTLNYTRGTEIHIVLPACTIKIKDYTWSWAQSDMWIWAAYTPRGKLIDIPKNRPVGYVSPEDAEKAVLHWYCSGKVIEPIIKDGRKE